MSSGREVHDEPMMEGDADGDDHGAGGDRSGDAHGGGDGRHDDVAGEGDGGGGGGGDGGGDRAGVDGGGEGDADGDDVGGEVHVDADTVLKFRALHGPSWLDDKHMRSFVKFHETILRYRCSRLRLPGASGASLSSQPEVVSTHLQRLQVR